MLQTFIDFQKYSSLKIGAKIPTKILQFNDLNCRLYDTTNKASFQSDSIALCKDLSSHDLSTNPKKPQIIENQSLSFSAPIHSQTISHLNLHGEELHIIGRANNLLVSPHAKNLAILGEDFNYISSASDYIEMGASVNSLHAFLFFKKHNLAGLEFLKNLPGNIGALCNMNAGMKQYEIAQSLISLNINGEWIDKKDVNLQYRGRDSHGVIFAARFHKKNGFRYDLLDIFNNMRKTHPKNPSCGSCFKNPPNDYAGRLLELYGFKGFMINNVGFSAMHANFLVNLGGAKFEDAIKVINLAKTKIYEQTGIALECEVKICN